MNEVIIAPSILSADFSKLAEEIKSVEAAGAKWIHVDVMDGHFVPNITIGPVVVRWIRKATANFLDVHLMIDNPSKYADDFLRAGSDGITFHVEAEPEPLKLIRKIRSAGKKTGISLRPGTPLKSILPFVPEVDMVLVMTVEPGFGGQKFMPDMMPKVRELRYCVKKNNLKCLIEADGGINPETAPIAVNEGANVLVAGNSVFGEKDRTLAVKNIMESLTKHTEII